MPRRLRDRSSERNIPRPGRGETGDGGISREERLLTPRSAGILGGSFAIAVCAGGLTYLGTGGGLAALAWAVLGGGAAFAGAIRLLDSIVT